MLETKGTGWKTDDDVFRHFPARDAGRHGWFQSRVIALSQTNFLSVDSFKVHWWIYRQILQEVPSNSIL